MVTMRQIMHHIRHYHIEAHVCNATQKIKSFQLIQLQICLKRFSSFYSISFYVATFIWRTNISLSMPNQIVFFFYCGQLLWALLFSGFSHLKLFSVSLFKFMNANRKWRLEKLMFSLFSFQLFSFGKDEGRKTKMLTKIRMSVIKMNHQIYFRSLTINDYEIRWTTQKLISN